MCRVFFTRSSISGRLGCSHVLAVVSSAAVNLGVHVSFQIMVFSGYRLHGLLRPMALLHLLPSCIWMGRCPAWFRWWGWRAGPETSTLGGALLAMERELCSGCGLCVSFLWPLLCRLIEHLSDCSTS